MLEVSFDLAEQILSMLAEEVGQAWAPEDYAGPFAKAAAETTVDLDALSVTVLRQQANAAGVKGYSKMAKPDLSTALS